MSRPHSVDFLPTKLTVAGQTQASPPKTTQVSPSQESPGAPTPCPTAWGRGKKVWRKEKRMWWVHLPRKCINLEHASSQDPWMQEVKTRSLFSWCSRNHLGKN